MLQSLAKAPDLVITDSQAFRIVHDTLPEGTPLTSFSVLFAAYKGDALFFAESARKIAALPRNAHILIAEACTHKPLREDIGRVKLPRLLKKKLGEGIAVTVTAGHDFPEDLAPYDLVIHCGACMFNRRFVLARIAEARAQGVPITNYGIALAWLTGILDKVSLGAEARP